MGHKEFYARDKTTKEREEGDGTEEDRLLLRNLTVWDPDLPLLVWP